MANFTKEDLEYLFLGQCKVVGGSKGEPVYLDSGGFLFGSFNAGVSKYVFGDFKDNLIKPYISTIPLFSRDLEYQKTLDNIVEILSSKGKLESLSREKFIKDISVKLETQLNKLCSFDLDFEKNSNIYAAMLASVYVDPSDIFGVYKKKFQKSKNNPNLLGDNLYELYKSGSTTSWGKKEHTLFGMINRDRKPALASAFTLSVSNNKDLSFEQAMEDVRGALGPFTTKALFMMYSNCLSTVAKEKNVSQDEFKKEFDILVSLLEENKNSHLLESITNNFMNEKLIAQSYEPQTIDVVLSSGINTQYHQTLSLSNNALMKLFNKPLVKVEEYQRVMFNAFESWNNKQLTREDCNDLEVSRLQLKGDETGFRLTFKSKNLDVMKKIEENFNFFITVVPLFNVNKDRAEIGKHFADILDSAFHKKKLGEVIEKSSNNSQEKSSYSMGGFKL